jgi:hypothetical protein
MSIVSAVLDEVMEMETPQEASAGTILSGRPDGRNADMPEWFRARQQEAWTRFNALPMPTRKDQAWRFSTSTRSTFRRSSSGRRHATRTPRHPRALHPLDEVAGRLIYADDHPAPSRIRSSQSLARSRRYLKPLERA